MSCPVRISGRPANGRFVNRPYDDFLIWGRFIMVLAFTGHRPEKLPWGSDETDARCGALKQQLLEAVRTAAGEGYDTFLCGMARGCDYGK